MAPKDFDRNAFLRALAALVTTHPSLRAMFPGLQGHTCRTSHVLPQSQADRLSAAALRVIDLPAEASADDVTAACTWLSASLKPEEGQVFCVGLIHRGDHLDRIFIAVHHYVVDAYSFRVLEDDLVSAYVQARSGVLRPQLPPTSCSLRRHAERTEQLRSAQHPRTVHDLWPAQVSLAPHATGPDRVGDERLLVRTLEASITERLYEAGAASPGASLELALLAALAHGVHVAFGLQEVRIALERTGRGPDETDRDTLDRSRLVGWLTRLREVRVDMASAPSLLELRALLAAQLRTATWLDTKPFLPVPEIALNHLGPARRATAGSLFEAAPEALGPLRAPEAIRLFPLEVLSEVRDGALRIAFHHNPKHVDEVLLQRLTDATLEALIALSGAKPLPAEGGGVPRSIDTSLAGVGERTLSRLLRKRKTPL